MGSMKRAGAAGALGLAMALALAGCAGTSSPELLAASDGSPPATSVGITPSTSTSSEPTSTTIAETSTSSAPPTTEAREPVVLGFAGDTSFTHGNHEKDPLAAVADVLSAPDLMVLNLETAVADPDVGAPPVPKKFLFKSPPASLDLLTAAGVDVVSLANNHALDYGPEAVAQTLDELDRRQIGRVGAGLDEASAYGALLVDVGGWRIGLVGLSRVPCDWSADGVNHRPQIAWACPAFVDLADRLVSETVAEADVTVVMVHGGIEGELCPADYMTELDARWAALGADIVVNGHPHVLQGVTSVEDTLVARSTGNFAFPSARGLTANSGVFLFTVSEDGISWSIEPLRVDGGIVRPATEVERVTILDQVNRYSDGWQAGTDGVFVPADVSSGC